MPRAARVLLPGHIYHLTHRCHNGSFFLLFHIYRNEYRQRLWQAVRRFKICMLNYCVTSNHTHLLLAARRPASISLFMRHLEGEFASYYNRRKCRHGAFWNERYHSTLVEGGIHLWNCMRYVDLNMVRAGVVHHPADWPWCGYQEIAGLRKRYNCLDADALLGLSNVTDMGMFFEWYRFEMERVLEAGNLRREPVWTEAIAVGSEDFVRRIAALRSDRVRLEIKESANVGWYVRDPMACYGNAIGSTTDIQAGRIEP